jgi:hypothetical protein
MLITIILQGGTANQIFQYLAVQSIIKEKNLDNAIINFDISELKSKYITPRDYMLSELDIPTNFGSNFFAPRFNEQQFNHSTALERFILDHHNKKTPEIVIRGHFISHKYFNIKKHNSIYINGVALHVRLGDYFNCTKTRNYHGMIDYSLYLKDALVSLNLPNNTPVSVFTDGSDEYVKNLLIDFNIKEVITGDPLTSLKLMSRYSHLIIANSSYSLLAAYRANNKSSIVCPDKFFR